MTSQRWRRVEEIFERALEHPPGEREDFVRAQSGSDETIRQEVLELLAADAATGKLADGPPVELVSSALNEAASGARLGVYRIVRELGRGGMGTIYLAERDDGEFVKRFALKVIRRGVSGKEMSERFRLERQALARLSHPSIASLIDGGTTASGEPWFIMELVDGIAFDQYCDEKELSLRARLEIFREICAAVSHAHRRLVVHRDLKPSNILVTEEGRPKLLDFGIARLLDDAGAPLTRDSHAPLTPGYASPEQESGGIVTTASDIFSLGVLLYELLTGLPPARFRPEGTRRVAPPERPSAMFQRLGQVESQLAHTLARARRSTPGRLVRSLRGDLDRIVLAAMHPDPEGRYPSVDDLGRDIGCHLDSRPVQARPSSAVYRARLFIRRHRLPLLAAVLVVLSLAMSAATWVRSAQQDRRRLEEILRLADVKTHADLVAAMDALHPAEPTRIPDLEDWLARAHALADRLPRHRATLATMTGAGGNTQDALGGAWQYETLQGLVKRLEAFTESDLHGPTIANVEARLDLASSVHARSIEEPRNRWEQISREVAEDPRYANLALAPQLGLVPLGRDPDSGLCEFWHLASGSEPKRLANGRLLAREEDGLVFVLVPAGTFFLGAQPKDPDAPCFDPLAKNSEQPVREVTLDAFFLSKYEMTQAQWRRLTGANPSNEEAGSRSFDEVISPLNPVESVTWLEAERLMRQQALALPTEAQWEYACRAGTQGRWPTGDAKDDLGLHANLADISSLRLGVLPAALSDESIDDGHAVHAAMNEFEANAFGFVHMIGNVQEWCADVFSEYQSRLPRPGDGQRFGQASEMRVMRGGAFNTRPEFARASARFAGAPRYASNDTGLRPSRAVLPPLPAPPLPSRSR